MSNVVQHSHSSLKSKKKNSGALVVIISLIAIVAILFGLNSYLSNKNKKDTSLISKVVDAGYTFGGQDAKFKLVEYADFQCPACAVFSPILHEVVNNINSKYGSSTLSLTFKYFPLVSIHSNALLSTYSVESAKNQGKFWEMHDILFARQDDWGEALDAKSKIDGYAKEIGLDMNKFLLDRDSQEVKDVATNALREATKLGLNHTPTIFLNGEELENISLSVEAVQKIIEEKINNSLQTSSSTLNN
ncbi:MAG: hypothetical protein RI945_285 [Candidatus Parcubacteria bacterium]|jgi:protein-disulfide isomerase